MTDDPFERAVRRAERSDQVDRTRQQVDDVTRAVSRPVRRISATLFRVHASVFVGVNLLLLVIWLTVTPTAPPWFLYVFLGWGIGLVAHYAAVKDHLRRRH